MGINLKGFESLIRLINMYGQFYVLLLNDFCALFFEKKKKRYARPNDE